MFVLHTDVNNFVGILPQYAMVAMAPIYVFVWPRDSHMVSCDKTLMLFTVTVCYDTWSLMLTEGRHTRLALCR